MTDRQQLVRLGKFSFRTGRSALELLRAVFSPHCSSPCTPTTAYIKTPLSSSWSLQMTPHSSASSRTVTSLLTDRRLRSWLSGAVVTTWSLTRSKLWRWSWTSGETPLLSPPHWMSGVIQVPGQHHFPGPELGQSHWKRPSRGCTSFTSWRCSTCHRSCWNSSTLLSLNPSSACQYMSGSAQLPNLTSEDYWG